MGNKLVIKNLNNSILKDISFSLKEGEFCALLGKSGSGKTLLIKSIAGLIKANGSINLNNNNSIYNNLNHEIGIYFDNSNLSNDSVFLNLIEPLINIGVSHNKAKKKVYDITKKIGIENLIYKDMNSISYGEKKIVSLVKSIIHEPELILLDSPFDSLDNYYKHRFINYLQVLKETKRIIVIFTTNTSEDLFISDKIAIMNNGRIIACDTKKKILEDESTCTKNCITIPFVIDLSHKLKSYGLIKKTIYNNKEMMDALWR